MVKRRHNSRRRRVKARYVRVKSKFKRAIRQLMKMDKGRQRQVVRSANNEFIKDFASTVGKLRYKPQLVSEQNARKLQRHRRKLRVLADSRASIKRKRRVLNQTGGIAPFLIPIIAAGIGAGGSIGASAVHAAISRA